MQTDKSEALYIDTQDKLEQLCLYYVTQAKNQQESLTKETNFPPFALFLDTEFIRQTTYFPKLALIQITDGYKVAIIDPLSINDLSPFYDLCFDSNILKVFHSGSQDLEIFYHLCGKLPEPVFDTQIAAAALEHGLQVGYAPLVKELLDIELDKSQTRTNWLHRPLSQAQIIYAGNDVIYLEKIYQKLRNELILQNRLDWLNADFTRLSQCSTYAIDHKNLWKKVKGYFRLSSKKLMLLQLLAEFREKLAIKKNKVRKHVITDEILLKIAQYQYSDESIQSESTLNQLIEDLNLPNHVNNLLGNELAIIIKTAYSCNKDNYPIVPKRLILTKEQSLLSKQLVSLCESIANQNKVTTNYLFQRKELERIIYNHFTPSEGFSSPLFTGWRDEIIGQEIRFFLSKV